MADARIAILAITFFVLVVAVIMPLSYQETLESVQESNADYLYRMESKGLYGSAVIAVEDGKTTLDGTDMTSMGLQGTVVIMSDVLTMAVDMETGGYQAWTILLAEQGCRADSESDPTLVYTFSRGHLTITDTADASVSLTSWFRFLLVPAADGDIGIWKSEDMPEIFLDPAKTFYCSYAEGDSSGTVWGTVGNVAAGQCIADGARGYGSASAISEAAERGTVHLTGFDAVGGIVGDGLFAADIEYSQEAEMTATHILMSIIPIILLIATIAIVTKVK